MRGREAKSLISVYHGCKILGKKTGRRNIGGIFYDDQKKKNRRRTYEEYRRNIRAKEGEDK